MTDTPTTAALRQIEDITVEMVKLLGQAGLPIAARGYATAMAVQIRAIHAIDSNPLTPKADHADR